MERGLHTARRTPSVGFLPLRHASFRLRKDDPLGFGADRCQNGYDYRDRPRHDREREAVVSVKVRGDAGLKRRVHGRE